MIKKLIKIRAIFRLRFIQLPIFVIAIIGCITLLAGCHGFISTYGTVYEWVDAPASEKGNIYIDEEVNLDDKVVQPMADVKIYFSCNYGMTYVTDSNGTFHQFGSAVPTTEYSIEIKAEKEGYYSLEKTFTHIGGRHGKSGAPGKIDHSIVILLVCSND
jgi:hypothetical protein